MKLGPFCFETARGRTVTVFGRTLTPVSRVISGVRHRGTIRTASLEGKGWGIAWVQPVALIETRDGNERILPVNDGTHKLLGRMALAALAISAVSMALILANQLLRND
jgi:uncharacterized spore protein YtfJ